MKKIKECPLLFGIVLTGIVLSLIGYLGKSGIYQDMGRCPRLPMAAVVIQGITEGKYPWQMLTEQTPDSKPDGDWQAASASETEAAAETEAGTEEGLVIVNTTEAEQTYEFTRVDESYFDDAVFIGDSRTVGLHDYSGWDHTTYYASIGMTIYKLFTDPVVEENGEKITIEQALTGHSFKKIYLMVGINEMGTGTVDSFMEEYEAAVAHLRELQPSAIIFVQGIMYVKQEKSENDPIFNNPNIKERNDRIAKLANNRDIFYIDVNEVVTDETGNLNPAYTYDEIHLLGKHYNIWMEFLMDHGIVKE